MKPIIIVLCLIISSSIQATPVNTAQNLGVFDIYKQNRQLNIANYITVDLWLTAYSLLRQSDWQQQEQQQLIPALTAFSQLLLKETDKHPKDAAGNANRDLASIIAKLLNPEAHINLSATAQQEWQLIQQATGIQRSPLWLYQMDYSQYQVRGYYQQNTTLKRYFQAFRYLSTIAWYINPSKSTGIDTALANRLLLQSHYLIKTAATTPEFNQLIQRISNTMQWQFGQPDDLTFSELQQTLKQDQAISLSTWRKQINRYARQQQRQPKLRGGMIKDTSDNTAENQLAWRLLPLALDHDQLALQIVLFPNTGDYMGDIKATPFSLLNFNGRKIKGYASLYELAFWQMQNTGQAWLKHWQENQFQQYQTAQQTAQQQHLNATGLQQNQQQLFDTLLQHSVSNPKARLSAALAFWTWQRYIALLYQKPSYGLIGKGLTIEQPRLGANIEKAPHIYMALLNLIKQHQQHSKNPAWQSLKELLTQAMSYAAQTQALTEQQQQFLNQLDLSLLKLTGKSDQPITFDLFTEPNSKRVVTEAIGYADIEYNAQARGARLSHYEFKQPLAQRMTDESWQQRLQQQYLQLNAVKTNTFLAQ